MISVLHFISNFLLSSFDEEALVFLMAKNLNSFCNIFAYVMPTRLTQRLL